MNEIDNHGSEIFPTKETVRGNTVVTKKSSAAAVPLAAPLLSIGAAGLITLAAVSGGLEASNPTVQGGVDYGAPPAIVEVQQPVEKPTVTAPPVKKPPVSPTPTAPPTSPPPTTPPPTTPPPTTEPPANPVYVPPQETETTKPAAPTTPPPDTPTDQPTDAPTEQPYSEPDVSIPYTDYERYIDPDNERNIRVSVPFRIYMTMNSATSVTISPSLSFSGVGSYSGSCAPSTYTINPSESNVLDMTGQANFVVPVPPDGTPDPFMENFLDPADKQLTMTASHTDGTHSGTVTVVVEVPQG